MKKHKQKKRYKCFNKKSINETNVKAAIKSVGNVLSIIIALISLVLSFLSFRMTNAEKLPVFLLDVKDSVEQSSSNKLLEIHNSGGIISNAKLTPYMHLELELSQGKNQLSNYIIEFSDFYSSIDCFYDSQNNGFVINEQKANELFVFIKELENYLSKHNININLYAIQHYFDISYSNFKGENCSVIYEVLNNHNYYLWYSNDDNERYFNDNELIKIMSIPEYNMRMPVVDPYSVAENIINYVDFTDYKSNTSSDIAETISTKKTDGIVKDINGFAIGFRAIIDNN